MTGARRVVARLGSFALVPSASIAGGAAGCALALAAWLRSASPDAVAFDPRTVAPPAAGASASRLVGVHENASVHHLATASGVKPHVHRTHEETVVVLSGKGRVRIGDAAYELAPGLTLLVPRNTVHSLEVDEGTAEAISVFTPPFDGRDRVFVGAAKAQAPPGAEAAPLKTASP